jgi:hypothetical protein
LTFCHSKIKQTQDPAGQVRASAGAGRSVGRLRHNSIGDPVDLDVTRHLLGLLAVLAPSHGVTVICCAISTTRSRPTTKSCGPRLLGLSRAWLSQVETPWPLPQLQNNAVRVHQTYQAARYQAATAYFRLR